MMKRTTLAAAALLCAAAPLAAQGTPPAVATPPALGPAPKLTLPKVQTATLPNGLKVQVVEMHAVPLVQAMLMVEGGGRLDGERPGLASFTAGMLSEGAGSRDAFQLAAELEFLGASLSTRASWDATAITLGAPKRTFAQAMDLMGDVVLRPTFKAADVKRQRDLRLAGLMQRRDQPAAVADLVFSKLVFPKGHPYHAPMGGDSASTAALDSATVRAFWEGASDPKRATLIVAGDITLAEAKALAASTLGAWRSPAKPLTAPAPAALPVPARPATRVILVDKPDAAQSVISIGAPGLARTSPDYPAITLMNTILGGSFSSRLNDILREQKGFTYGARSSFQWQPVPGPFVASAAVRTDVTDSSLIVFFEQFKSLREKAVDADELARAKAFIVLGSLGSFETTRQVAGQLGAMNTFGLPLATIPQNLAAVEKLTAADVQRAARQYVDPAQLTVVVVGDVAKIRPGIEALGLGPIAIYDADGNPVVRP